MSITVYSKNPIDYTQAPMFFGEHGMNVQRYDDPRYPKFEELARTQWGFFWQPEEFDLTKDVADFKLFTEAQKRIFTLNIKYQILLDSIQGRSPGLAFKPFVTNPELEQNLTFWEAFETVHSRSYSHIIRNLYNNPDEIFKDVLLDEYIQARATSVVSYYDDFLQDGIRYRAKLLDNPGLKASYELKKKLYLAMVSVYILEAIRFYVSFACTFAFGENKTLDGSTKIVALIARDELVHVTLTKSILKKFQSGNEGAEWVTIAADCHDQSLEMFESAIEEEKDWARYLFQDGSIIGLNDKILHQYIDHLAYYRIKGIGLNTTRKPVENPLSWMANWIGGAQNVQIAPQETELQSYVIAKTDTKVDFGKMAKQFEL